MKRLWLLVLLWPALSIAEISRPFVSQGRRMIAPGVLHQWGACETTTAGRQAVHFVEVDLDTPVTRIESSLSNDRLAGLEPTTSQGNRKNREEHRAVAAINGDFWSLHDAPSGLHIENGELIADGPQARPSFGVRAGGDAILGEVTVAGSATRPDGTTLEIARVNQQRSSDQLVLYTARFGDGAATDDRGIEVVLAGVALPLQPQGSYSGIVSAVHAASGNTVLSTNDVILSGSGTAAQFLTALKSGDRVAITLSITSGWENVVHAVGGGHWLVQNGAMATASQPGFSDVTHPRSAVGLTAKGNVIFATVDGRQPGYSIGVTLPELAELMIGRGAVTAINLDGGGSTTMAVRPPGYDGLTQVNRGSDGFERAVSNSILVFSSAPTGALATAKVEPEDAALYVGTRQNYLVRGQDAAFNAVFIAPSEVTWSATASVATIDSSGRLTAGEPGLGAVTARVGEIAGTTSVVVVRDLVALEVAPNPAVVEPRSTQVFTARGRDAAGRTVIVDPNVVSWSAAGPIGSISSGVLTASATGSGSISAAAGGIVATAAVDIGKPPVVLEDFEDLSDLRASTLRATAVLSGAMRPAPVRFGTRAARLAYDFRQQPSGTSAAYLTHDPPRTMESRPKGVGVWVYGNSSLHWIRGSYLDGNDSRKIVDFTPQPTPAPICANRKGGIDWTGWKYLQAEIPANAILPLKWERIYVAEIPDLCDDAGELFFDDLRAVYGKTREDLIGPTVTELTPQPGSRVTQARPSIGGTVRDEASGIAASSIRLLIDGVQVKPRYDSASGRVRFVPRRPLSPGLHRIRLEAQDHAGNPAQPFGEWSFIVER